MIQIVPAILPQKFADIAAQAARVAGIVPRAQIDIADGIFAPEKTWPYLGEDAESDFAKLIRQDEGFPEWGTLDYELDMMIEHPQMVVDQWIDAGIAAVIPHIESGAEDEIDQVMRAARSRGVGFGIALIPSTPTHALDRWYRDVDFIQVMGSNTIGRQGTPLADSAVDKIIEIKRMWPDCVVAVDIGVNEETAPRLVAAGATKLVSGSAIWNSTNVKESITRLQSIGG
jgi:ribulose-phosphate 3-epimerase